MPLNNCFQGIQLTIHGRAASAPPESQQSPTTDPHNRMPPKTQFDATPFDDTAYMKPTGDHDADTYHEGLNLEPITGVDDKETYHDACEHTIPTQTDLDVPSPQQTQRAEIEEFWSKYDPAGVIYKEAEKIGELMFAKRKVPEGSVQDNVLQKLKETLELRHEYLNKAGMEEDEILVTDQERRDFLQFAKKKFHEQPEQVEKQRIDQKMSMEQRDPMRFLHNRRHSRWGCYMQRLCGTKGYWEVVSFTGQVKYSLLSEVKHTPTPVPDTILKDKARHARANFRLAARLKKM